MNSPSVRGAVQSYASTPSKPSSLSNVIDVDDILLEDSSSRGTPRAERLVAGKDQCVCKKRGWPPENNKMPLWIIISVTPTRQTLKSERGDFNILRST